MMRRLIILLLLFPGIPDVIFAFRRVVMAHFMVAFAYISLQERQWAFFCLPANVRLAIVLFFALCKEFFEVTGHALFRHFF